MQKIQKHTRGFSLVEMIVYIGLSGGIILSIASFLMFTLQARKYYRVVTEVEMQGASIMHLLTREIRTADSLTTPTLATQAGILVLDPVGTTRDPLEVGLIGGVIEITTAGGSSVPLHNSMVTASEFVVSHVGTDTGSASVRIQFTLSHINPQGKAGLVYEKDFIGTATLRK